jgi:hypothetical protein
MTHHAKVEGSNPASTTENMASRKKTFWNQQISIFKTFFEKKDSEELLFADKCCPTYKPIEFNFFVENLEFSHKKKLFSVKDRRS